MINVKLIGGLGNNMFQYSLGRILAEQKGYNLAVDGINNLQKYFLNVVNIDTNKTANGEPLHLGYDSKQNTIQHVNLEEVLHHDGPINLAGFFQKHEYYVNHLDTIKQWFAYNDSSYFKPNENDLVIHYRLTDYTSLNWHLPPEAFIETIHRNNIKHDNCYLITDQPNHPFIQQLLKIKNLTVVNQTELADFTLLKYAKQLIVSHSSFSWWASFLGHQDKVYIPMYKNSTSIWKTFPDQIDDVDLIPNCKKYIKQILE